MKDFLEDKILNEYFFKVKTNIDLAYNKTIENYLKGFGFLVFSDENIKSYFLEEVNNYFSGVSSLFLKNNINNMDVISLLKMANINDFYPLKNLPKINEKNIHLLVSDSFYYSVEDSFYCKIKDIEKIREKNREELFKIMVTKINNYLEQNQYCSFILSENFADDFIQFLKDKDCFPESNVLSNKYFNDLAIKIVKKDCFISMNIFQKIKAFYNIYLKYIFI